MLNYELQPFSPPCETDDFLVVNRFYIPQTCIIGIMPPIQVEFFKRLNVLSEFLKSKLFSFFLLSPLQPCAMKFFFINGASNSIFYNHPQGMMISLPFGTSLQYLGVCLNEAYTSISCEDGTSLVFDRVCIIRGYTQTTY